MNYEFLTNFIFYDIIFLILFTLGVFLFLVKRKKKIEREGLMYIYRTQVGVRIIDKLSKKFEKFLRLISPLIIFTGYLLMISIIYLLVVSVWQYISNPAIIQIIKAPPIMVLVPYFTRIFGVQQLFPEFYFLYFILAIAIVAIAHEGFHGLYMRLYKVRIKSTGFGFLGPFIGFFVEQNDKDLTSKKTREQLTILAGGVFANIIVGLILLLMLILYFNNTYVAYGIEFNNYAMATIPTSIAENYIQTNESLEVDGGVLSKVIIQDKSYFVNQEFYNINFESYKDKNMAINVYQDQAAIRNSVKGTITSIGNNEIKSVEDLSKILESHNPGDSIILMTEEDGEILSYELRLNADYKDEKRAVLGIIVGPKNMFRFFNIIETWYKDYGVAYRAVRNPDATEFFYNLFAWIIIINLLVALFNMLPAGIFDGGRFFYLTILAITRKEKIAKKAFKYSTVFLLFLLVLLMLVWFYRILV